MLLRLGLPAARLRACACACRARVCRLHDASTCHGFAGNTTCLPAACTGCLQFLLPPCGPTSSWRSYRTIPTCLPTTTATTLLLPATYLPTCTWFYLSLMIFYALHTPFDYTKFDSAFLPSLLPSRLLPTVQVLHTCLPPTLPATCLHSPLHLFSTTFCLPVRWVPYTYCLPPACHHFSYHCLIRITLLPPHAIQNPTTQPVLVVFLPPYLCFPLLPVPTHTGYYAAFSPALCCCTANISLPFLDT